MKKFLITFGTVDYKNAVDSLVKSANKYFDNIKCFTPLDIDSNFLEKNKNILNQQRGAGYWLWKPYIIHKVLNEINPDDLVFYVDAGNIFVENPEILYQYKNLNDGIILFDNRDGMTNGNAASNNISCKKDTFVLMDCDNEKYIYGTHLNASYQIYFKNKNTLNFINQYLFFCQNEFILTDTPNMYGFNYSGYYDHRHDQSVLSLLAIRENVKPLVDPSEWGNTCNCRGFNQLFHHHRNKYFEL